MQAHSTTAKTECACMCMHMYTHALLQPLMNMSGYHRYIMHVVEVLQNLTNLDNVGALYWCILYSINCIKAMISDICAMLSVLKQTNSAAVT
jgi:hypothetical protein